MDINLNSITGIPTTSFFNVNDLGTNPTALIILSLIIIGYYTLFASLGKPSTDTNTGKGIVFIEVLIWGVFVLLVLLNGMSYIFNMDITASIKNLFAPVPEIDIVVDNQDLAGDPTNSVTTVPEIKLAKQVYHIPANKFVYQDAKAVCNAYGGRLANYKDMENAYKKGADWCGFGWSEDQMALYPTQVSKWKHLQKIPGHEHDCGRPGINGGYIKNPNVRFGINCFGYKPKITSEEALLMENSSLYPLTRKEKEFNERVDYWREKLPEILVAPFNQNNWSIL